MINKQGCRRAWRGWMRAAGLLIGLALCSTAGAQAAGAPAGDTNAQGLAVRLQAAASRYGCTVAAEDISAVQRLHANEAAGETATALWPPSAPATASLLQAIRQAEDAGLNPADYCAATLTQALTSTPLDSSAPADRDDVLSAMALKLLRELRQGRVEPRVAGFDLQRPRTAADDVASLQQLAASNDAAGTMTAILEAAEPHYVHYKLLKTALAQYRRLSAEPWLALPAFSARSIKPGEIYAGAPGLRQRLALLGDLGPEPPPEPTTDIADGETTLDPALSTALARFQQRHGLQADGVLGRRTLAALNVSPTHRVRQIELSLERWRWLPDVNTRAIVVNIPQFRLFAFASAEDRELGMLDMPVVVGQDYEDKRTPVFAGQLQYVVFRPYWDVPYRISHREILPAQARDPGYLSTHHFELVDGQSDNSPVIAATPENLARVEAGKIRIRQRPGDDNALGNVKFLLPNPYNVYLHSTPAQALFAQARRAFSHGCIRVSDPAALAAYVLRDTPGNWRAERIAAAMNGEPNQRITLTNSIPVMILYSTAVATESGRVYFLEDLYQHDRKLEHLLKLAPLAETAP